MSIHREGRTLLFWLLLILVAVNFGLNRWIPEQETVLNIVLLVSIVLYLLILQFFRNPFVQLPNEEKLVFAPADGKVVVIEETTESEYLNDRRKQVSIFMSPINVHINRSPIAGVVEFFKYHPGKYLVAWHPKSSTENERTTMVLTHKSGVKILVRQIAGALARRIKWYVKEGTPLAQGGEFGFIKFGSRVDVFLPLDAEILVSLEEKTKGGRTPIARLK
ncbi:phosphatidylserine decarboxylase family protein [Aquiflexum gelatinilyticum]|uniref:Phosphatidylserine decarboxylase proenzyme n=1 Tax=Aquiflexum gelatinilyticum TaxID=2961943 RepID=A0A9X2PC18_9BACT|nr:phosphatidylserine decarboxylase family protein [Aquiflexum gelatinilyticum]MCR9016859.1 phosphatidylserine decarboxylase family protein [Aquiflexum gelatinilyticum]MCS4433714.1 phosphatidylserine decarboxylase family protein [Aquiflexum gelatinilyticum]